ncbi:MAG: TonB-dependent receptor [Saprospiraceae bacterium]
MAGCDQSFSQEDSIRMFVDESEVIITAAKMSRTQEKLPIPVQVIGKREIQQTGAVRLQDILQQQSGINTVSMLGTGVQMQGLDPDYTQILIDGEPLTGRSGGTLDLSRIVLGNVQQIEILKGPASSLYGSNALAGVINIITEQPVGSGFLVRSMLSPVQAPNLQAEIHHGTAKFKSSLFADYTYSPGYDLDPETYGKTVEPYHQMTIHGKLSAQLSTYTKWTASVRHVNQTQWNAYEVTNPADVVTGNTYQKEWLAATGMHHYWNEHLKHSLRVSYSTFNQDLLLVRQESHQVEESLRFFQQFIKPEWQQELIFRDLTWYLGAGGEWEQVQSDRYEVTRRRAHPYGFTQLEWQRPSWQMLASARYDNYVDIASSLSPKLSLKYHLNDQWSVGAGWGQGFKVPDFRQLYLNFANSVAGYQVLGSAELPTVLADLESQQLIDQYLVNPDLFGEMQPERSNSGQFFADYHDKRGNRMQIQAFRNDIRQLIETLPVARRTNGQLIYSYLNLNKVYTQGIEWSGSWMISPQWQLKSSYQYLQARDKDVLTSIDQGKVYRRNPETLRTERLTRNDYGGLFNRSAHQAQIQLTYQSRGGWSVQGRCIYRSRFGFADLNGNSILDAASEYVPGYGIGYLSVQKYWKSWIFKGGVDNLTNYHNATYLPQIPGITPFVGFEYQFDFHSDK